MQKFSVERFVYDVTDPSDDWIVTKIGHSKLEIEKIEKCKIKNMFEYESGCSSHNDCLGHMCVSEDNVMMPIHSLSVHNVNMQNSVYSAVENLLTKGKPYGKKIFMQKLSDSMRRKNGRMRKEILNSHIDGSLRMVITPQWRFPTNVVAIPFYLRGKWKVYRLDPTVNKYESRPVENGDWAIVVRPPSLSPRSVQPMKIKFWNETCMGTSPYIVKAFDGDFDGDEMHVNPVYSEESLKECKESHNTVNDSMDVAERIYRDWIEGKEEYNEGSYMKHTTLSFLQIAKGVKVSELGTHSRMRHQHIEMIQSKILDPTLHKLQFDKDSIKGMADINRRYLTQPIVGDMARIAKICASCVYVDDKYRMGIESDSGFVMVMRSRKDQVGGNSAMRAISAICASAQQVALDSHRVSKDTLPSHDMITDLLKGSDKTMVAVEIEGKFLHSANSRGPLYWKASQGHIYYLLCSPAWRELRRIGKMVAAYNPTVLVRVDKTRRREV